MMNTVTLHMVDMQTDNTIQRTIDVTNAMSSTYPCWKLGNEEQQRQNLERWINERGNEQHEATLILESWTIQ